MCKGPEVRISWVGWSNSGEAGVAGEERRWERLKDLGVTPNKELGFTLSVIGKQGQSMEGVATPASPGGSGAEADQLKVGRGGECRPTGLPTVAPRWYL